VQLQSEMRRCPAEARRARFEETASVFPGTGIHIGTKLMAADLLAAAAVASSSECTTPPGLSCAAKASTHRLLLYLHNQGYCILIAKDLTQRVRALMPMRSMAQSNTNLFVVVNKNLSQANYQRLVGSPDGGNR